jgi:hypothetical protein
MPLTVGPLTRAEAEGGNAMPITNNAKIAAHAMVFIERTPLFQN